MDADGDSRIVNADGETAHKHFTDLTGRGNAKVSNLFAE